jgi:hypothetical protein
VDTLSPSERAATAIAANGASRELDPSGRNRESWDGHAQSEDATGIGAIRTLRAGHHVEVSQIVTTEADARHHRQRAADPLALAAVGLEDDHGTASRRRNPDGAVLGDGESVRNALVHSRQHASRTHTAVGAHVVHADDAGATVRVIDEANLVGPPPPCSRIREKPPYWQQMDTTQEATTRFKRYEDNIRKKNSKKKRK